jgi:hypothetical protein
LIVNFNRSVKSQEWTHRTGWTALVLLASVIGSVAQVHDRNGLHDSSADARSLAQPADDLTRDAVTVTGTIVSADTGDPIEGGHIIILNPGISPTGYAEDPSNPDAVFADGESDVNGRFQAAPPVRREQSYGVIVIARGYLGKVAEDRQFAGPNDPDVVDLGEIRMQSAT